MKGEHFIVYHIDDRQFAKDTLREAEKFYDRIAHDLGYSRYDNFWQWDKRVKIYIYSTHEDFLEATGRQKWIYGLAMYDEKEIITYRWNEGFLKSLLPHELTHLIFRDFIGFKGEAPLWLDEGVAQWQEEEKRKVAFKIVKHLIKGKHLIPLDELTQMDVREGSDALTSQKFYAEAVTLVGFMVEKYGGTRFTMFCRQLRDGKSINKALSFAYTTSIRDLNELEKRWMEYCLAS
ncbi:peptidase MA family metallohydrolase [Candidatus Omnitrophota bacterium]